MDKLDAEVIGRLAQLAALEIDESQAAGLVQDLTQWQNFVAPVGALNLDQVNPLSHPGDRHSNLRPDNPISQNHQSDLMQLAPESAEDHYLVPRVVE